MFKLITWKINEMSTYYMSFPKVCSLNKHLPQLRHSKYLSRWINMSLCTFEHFPLLLPMGEPTFFNRWENWSKGQSAQQDTPERWNKQCFHAALGYNKHLVKSLQRRSKTKLCTLFFLRRTASCVVKNCKTVHNPTKDMTGTLQFCEIWDCSFYKKKKKRNWL